MTENGELLSDMEVLQLVHSTDIRKRARFLCEPSVAYSVPAKIVYNEVLAQETFRKLVCHEDGSCEATTAPVSAILSENWRWWRLGDDGMMVGYVPDATQPYNKWWDNMRKGTQMLADKVKRMRGTLVLFRWCKQVFWQELDAKRELMNYFIAQYRHKFKYNFCW